MGHVFILQVHARKFCGQFTFLLMFIMLKSLFQFGVEVKDVWSYNFIFTVISQYFPECPLDNATSCYMNRWQSPDNGCSKAIIANNAAAETEVAETKCVCLHTSTKIYDIDCMLTGFVSFT